ncbi:MAG: alpha/beta fold hydrolase [Pseudomonadales bacterium]
MQVTANDITITYDTFGEKAHPALLLVMGLGAQMTAWDDDFCAQLADRGHYVIRYDNRDVGLSSYFHDHGVPDMGALVADMMAGRKPDIAYSLDDMAADGMGLLTALGIDRAHICGASLGGMIVQTMAILFPDRVKTLTSIMSTTGNPGLPPASPEAMAALTSERANNVDQAMDRAVAVSNIIGSPGFPKDESRTRAKAKASFERAFYPGGVARQMAAVVAHGDRRPGLNKLKVPTLVIHGSADPLVPVTGGIDTQENIPGATLMLIEGMGHDLPPETWDQIIDGISALTGRV